MDRREAITRVGIILGGTIIGANLFIEGGCTSSNSTKDVISFFTPERISFMDEIAETILPATKTPGAKAAKVGQFMSVMVRDCYTEADQKTFMEGFEKLDEASKKKNGKNFLESDVPQRTALFIELDAESKKYMTERNDREAKKYSSSAAYAMERNYLTKGKEISPAHYFAMMKQLTLLGFFTSEVGATQALRYKETPGRYDGNMPYKKGDKAWAT